MTIEYIIEVRPQKNAQEFKSTSCSPAEVVDLLKSLHEKGCYRTVLYAKEDEKIVEMPYLDILESGQSEKELERIAQQRLR